MSRIGKLEIKIPKGVEIKCNNNLVTVKGPKGELSQEIAHGIKIDIQDDVIKLDRDNENKQTIAYHGLYRSLINNMVIGVSQGFKKSLEINGVGYKSEKKDAKTITFSLGYSHTIDYPMPEGISFNIESKDGRNLSIEGIDKQLVGQVAANIRNLRKPEPYKGKGVKYSDEFIARKEGKTK